MKQLHEICAGVDVHRDTVVICVRTTTPEGAGYETETYGTTTHELERAAEWLRGQGVPQVVMEATGVYWKPVWAVFCEFFELTLANAMHVKNVPGRKTDANDAQWLSDLLAHGLVRRSFVPGEEQNALRDLTRTRKQLVRQRAAHVQRIDKILQTANIKLGSVVRDIMGVAGRSILDALAEGVTDAEALADGVKTNIKATRSAVVAAVHGRVTEHHRILLRLHLEQVDTVADAVARLDAEISDRLEEHRDTMVHLVEIPGVSDVAAAAIVSEIGFDMNCFPTAQHLVSWAGLCPRNDESAGKKRSTRLRKGAPWLKTLLVQTAWGAARTRRSYYRAQFARLRARRGPKKAVIAVAASLLTAIYYMLKRGTKHADLGVDYFDQRSKARSANRLAERIRGLGFDVQLKPSEG